MHKSRLAGFIIDCNTADLDAAAAFWSGALGLDAVRLSDPALSQSVTQRRDDRLLADDAGEVLGAPLAGQGLVGHESQAYPTA